MQANNPFDTKLASHHRLPEGMRVALTDVTDTLDFAWAAAQAVFEGRATPEHAPKVCELMLLERDRNWREDRRDYGSESRR